MRDKIYRVLEEFGDKDDYCYQYRVGDKYPRKGYRPNKARADELLGSDNAFGKPIIEVMDENVADSETDDESEE
jgi:hypothetical protein